MSKIIDAGSVSLAVCYYTLRGMKVFMPIDHHGTYNLLVDDGKKINRVKVISTNHLQNGRYRAALKSMGGTYGSKVKLFDPTSCDYVFIVCGNKDIYLIPSSDIDSKHCLVVDSYPTFRVNLW